MTVTAYLALGSNLGDRRAHLERALDLLAAHHGLAVTARSSFWETAPVGGPTDQGSYLNAAVAVQTALSPRELLAVLRDVEQRCDRVRQERFGPRTLDLDLLLHGDAVVREPDLVVPHPRLHQRTFVLGPLAEIAPTVRHPVLGKTVVELLTALGREPPLHGLRALVTGSSSGIGRAIVLALAEQGAQVIVHANRSVERGRTVVESIRAQGGMAEFLAADLADGAACHGLAESAWRTWDGLDLLVNNAGADTLTGAAATWPFERKLEALWAVDVRATALLAREVGRRMKARGSGVILNMGWDQAETGMEGDSGELFATAKAAVMGFSRSLALSLAPEVRVHCLAPGWIRTAWGESASDMWQERVRRETPLRRWGTPEDVAAAVCWLTSPTAAYLTGQVVRVNGGAVR